MTKRRDFLKAAPVVAGAALLANGSFISSAEAKTKVVNARGEYVLPPLPYAYNALEPFIDEQTMRLHHDKHHAGYVRGLNATLAKLKKAGDAGDYSQVLTSGA